MAKPRSTKRDIDKAKKDRAAQKRERRQRPTDVGSDAGAALPEAPPAPPPPEEEVLAALGSLHARFDGGELDFEEFEQLKGELLARLSTD